MDEDKKILVSIIHSISMTSALIAELMVTDQDDGDESAQEKAEEAQGLLEVSIELLKYYRRQG